MNERKNSKLAFERAYNVIPGGVNSPVRALKAVGTTPMKYILSIRIRNAQALLETTDYNISNIASMVGYENAFYFSRLFKKQKGLSPAAYRKIFREKYREHL